ncbi:MAG TPA: ferrochelatase [Nitrospiria bacterium]|nr:ferrochelatase [Nitrospiria bacterium]
MIPEEKGRSGSAAKVPIGVILLNLGGPDSLDAVEPFLYNLFSDPDIITLPFGFQWLVPFLAMWISKRRAKIARKYYTLIGGRSPLRELTESQRADLEKALSEQGNYRVFVGMRYWNPAIEEAVDQALALGIKKLIALPLFPQYSVTSSGSALNELNRVLERKKASLKVVPVLEWYNHPGYLQAMAENIEAAKKMFPPGEEGEIHLLFSAHGVPEKVIQKGDPYQKQIEETVRLVEERIPGKKQIHLAYQSRVGRLKWIGPSVEEKLKELAAKKVRKLLVVPVSFVSDHSETLYEIDILFRDRAKELGIPYFVRMPSLNSSPTFIRALKEIVAGRNGGTA